MSPSHAAVVRPRRPVKVVASTALPESVRQTLKTGAGLVGPWKLMRARPRLPLAPGTIVGGVTARMCGCTGFVSTRSVRGAVIERPSARSPTRRR